MGNVICKPIYVLNLPKGFVAKFDGEDYSNMVRGMTVRTNGPIDIYAIDTQRFRRLFDEAGIEDKIFVSTPFALHAFRKDGPARIDSKKFLLDGREVYLDFEDYFARMADLTQVQVAEPKQGRQ